MYNFQGNDHGLTTNFSVQPKYSPGGFATDSHFHIGASKCNPSTHWASERQQDALITGNGNILKTHLT